VVCRQQLWLVYAGGLVFEALRKTCEIVDRSYRAGSRCHRLRTKETRMGLSQLMINCTLGTASWALLIGADQYLQLPAPWPSEFTDQQSMKHTAVRCPYQPQRDRCLHDLSPACILRLPSVFLRQHSPFGTCGGITAIKHYSSRGILATGSLTPVLRCIVTASYCRSS
jgi:hypothetical protein